MIRTLFLDWSGTVADDLAPVLKATNCVLEEFGRPALSREVFRRDFRLPFVHFWRDYLPGIALEDIERSYHQWFVGLQDAVELLPGAGEFLKGAVEQGLRLFLLSSIKPAHFEAQAQRLGIGGVFDRAYTGVLDKREFLPVLIRDGVAAAGETLFVGDMVHDIEAGKAAGVGTVAVLTGYDGMEKLVAAGPDAVLDSLASLGPLLGRGERGPVATVGALIRHPDGERVLLCRTPKWKGKWGIPGGKIRRGETAEAALRREIAEETGLEIRDLTFATVQDSVDSPEYVRREHFLLLNYLVTACHEDVKLNEEADAFCWVEVGKGLAMDLNLPTRRLLEIVGERNGVAGG